MPTARNGIEGKQTLFEFPPEIEVVRLGIRILSLFLDRSDLVQLSQLA